MLRRLLGRMVLKPVYPEQGKPYYAAQTAIDVLVLLEPPGSDPGSDPGCEFIRMVDALAKIANLGRVAGAGRGAGSAEDSVIPADRG